MSSDIASLEDFMRVAIIIVAYVNAFRACLRGLMTNIGFEKHLPDLGLITHYSEFGKSPVHKISPWTKIILLPVVVFDITVITDLRLLLMILFAVVCLYWASELPIVLLLYWWTLPVFFVASITFLLIWSVPGSDLISYGPIHLTLEGVALFVALIVKTLIGVTYSLVLLMTTKYNYLTHIISKVLPYPLSQIALLTYRFLFLTLEGIQSTVIAMKSRGGLKLSGIRKHGKFYGSVFALAFIRSFDKADHVAKAMQSRGYQGKLASSCYVPRPSAGGYAFIFVAVLLSIFSYSFGRYL
ncbi:MAG: cobalt ECF transporter T component CbiQ [Euryarchaeota archaeon]|nr:cobalt ECF transporter T component CbiQ [Euryarchaeota archaeon]